MTFEVLSRASALSLERKILLSHRRIYVALVDDLVAVAGSLWVVSRFSVMRAARDGRLRCASL
jgi:hypothetical protein